MRLYGRGIRRRLAPMLGGDQRRIRLAYSLQFTLRGTPVIRYGEEIGMGDDLSQDGRGAGQDPAGFLFRVTIGLRKGGGEWRVVHEHHSLPAVDG